MARAAGSAGAGTIEPLGPAQLAPGAASGIGASGAMLSDELRLTISGDASLSFDDGMVVASASIPFRAGSETGHVHQLAARFAFSITTGNAPARVSIVAMLLDAAGDALAPELSTTLYAFSNFTNPYDAERTLHFDNPPLSIPAGTEGTLRLDLLVEPASSSRVSAALDAEAIQGAIVLVPVPEPAGAAVLGAAGIGLARRRRQRRA